MGSPDSTQLLMIGRFWVSGQYKGKGHGKALLQEVVEAARGQRKEGLVAVIGTKNSHFMSDTKWLLEQGSEHRADFKKTSNRPCFNNYVRSGECPVKEGIVVYYSNRCP